MHAVCGTAGVYERTSRVGPREDRTFQILDVNKTGFAQFSGENRGPKAHRAINNDGGVLSDTQPQQLRNGVLLRPEGSAQVTDRKFFFLANVEQERRRVQPGKLVGGEFDHLGKLLF